MSSLARGEYFAEFAAHRVTWARGSSAAARRHADGDCRDPRRDRGGAAATRGSFSPSGLVVSLGEARRNRPREGTARAGWVVSIQLDPPLGGSNQGLIEVAEVLQDTDGVGFVDLNDNPAAQARMNGLMAAVAIEREAGIETIRT